MSETATQTHLEAGGTLRKPCENCGTLFRLKRGWGRFCKNKCRNDFHAREARKEAQRAAAPELYDALLAARNAIRGRDAEHIWLNYPDKPELTLGHRIDQALAKAGYREPKPDKKGRAAS